MNRDPLVQRFAYDGVERATDPIAAEASLFCFQYNHAERCYRPMNRYFLLHLVLNRSAYIWKIKTTLVNQSYVRTMKRPLSNKTLIEAFGNIIPFAKSIFKLSKMTWWLITPLQVTVSKLILPLTYALENRSNSPFNESIRISVRFPEVVEEARSPFTNLRSRSRKVDRVGAAYRDGSKSAKKRSKWEASRRRSQLALEEKLIQFNSNGSA